MDAVGISHCYTWCGLVMWASVECMQGRVICVSGEFRSCARSCDLQVGEESGSVVVYILKQVESLWSKKLQELCETKEALQARDRDVATLSDEMLAAVEHKNKAEVSYVELLLW